MNIHRQTYESVFKFVSTKGFWWSAECWIQKWLTPQKVLRLIPRPLPLFRYDIFILIFTYCMVNIWSSTYVLPYQIKAESFLRYCILNYTVLPVRWHEADSSLVVWYINHIINKIEPLNKIIDFSETNGLLLSVRFPLFSSWVTDGGGSEWRVLVGVLVALPDSSCDWSSSLIRSRLRTDRLLFP